MDTASALRDFLEIPYDQLEEMNLAVKQQRLQRADPEQVREERIRYLEEEKRIKAVSVCFTDLEGRMHMLDYDKKFLLRSHDNLTFDGSSIRGFSQQAESDLRCPPQDNEQYFIALRHLGRTVEYVLYPDESHVYASAGRPDRRIDRMQRVLDWFEQYLP